MALGKLSVDTRPTNLDNNKAMAYSACRRCGCGLIGHFSLAYYFSSSSLSLGDGLIQIEILSHIQNSKTKRQTV